MLYKLLKIDNINEYHDDTHLCYHIFSDDTIIREYWFDGLSLDWSRQSENT